MADATEGNQAPPRAAGATDAEELHRLEKQRRENRDAVRDLGLAPYGGRTEGLISLGAARRRYDQAADEAHKARGKEEGFVDRRPVVRVAGRVMLHRDNGKLVWLQLRDHTTGAASGAGEDEAGAAVERDLQIAVSQRDCDEAGFRLAKVCDLGDIVVAEGPLTRTKTGEVTVWASQVRMGAKSLAPPPEKWSGLQDPETRYRQRYKDLYANPEVMQVFKMRSALMARIRRFFDERKFLEVETPVLQPQAGGAAARPFVSTLNALDMPVFLRIATELHLKRLLVGGMPRVYEMGTIFRNEGIDRRHNPEFTMIEAYEAFGDCWTMAEHTEALMRELAHFAEVATASPDVEAEDINPEDVKLPFGDLVIDYGSPFERITYADLFERALGFPMTDARRAREEAQHRGLEIEGLEDILVVKKLFDDFAEPTVGLERPAIVYDFPAALSPLARPKAEDPSVAERWELHAGGLELANAYTELNDPDVQEANFRRQLQGEDDEDRTFRTYDEDFIEALKVGMPPAGGLGIGVDRVVMLMTNQRSIRDVILFPFMRPL